MAKKIYSCTYQGLKVDLVEVEAEVSNGLPNFTIVGLGDTAVQESKERVRSSIKNSGLKFPSTRKTINLAPAQLKKHGSHFDLPIAISILWATNQIKIDNPEKILLVGELSLNGDLRMVSGILPITDFAKKNGFIKIFLPDENFNEASIIEGIEIIPVKNLKEILSIISHKQNPRKIKKQIYSDSPRNSKIDVNIFDDIIGLDKAKRALMISASGFHNILFMGSPGCGKTILMRKLEKLLPPLSLEESIETSKIYSVAGLLDEKNCLIKNRPFREVHHTSTLVSVIGGGSSNPLPGEISLAHNGVLFFDEILQFPRNILESLRQPLEDRFIRISRINFNYKYPAKFIFAAALNPCPCGYHMDEKIKCICTKSQIDNYQKKLSGPLLDRFDLFSKVEKEKMDQMFNLKNNANNDYLDFEKNIEKVHKIQIFRAKKLNSEMNLADINKFLNLTRDAKNFISLAKNKDILSNRAFIKVLKISRTIADLDNSTRTKESHIAEALQFRDISK